MRTAAMFALSMLILSGCSFTGGFGGERYALVYGIGSYSNINDLPFAAQDGVDMRQTLEAQGYTILSTHSGPQVTRSEMLEDIRMAADSITEHDVLFFYYAGHGSQSTFLDADGDFQRTEYLVFSDYSSGSSDGLLSTDDFYTELSGIAALHASIVMDACNSGGFLPPDTYGVDALPADYRHPIAPSDDGSSGYLDAFRDFFSHDGYRGISMISAAGADEFSYEWTDFYADKLNIPDEYRDNGIFTGFFLEASAVNDRGHMNGDANSDGALTLQEAYAYSFTRLDESWNSYWRSPENMFQTTEGGDDPVYYPHISGGTVDPVIFRLEWRQ
ncbi:caspase family protein [Salinispira pacifica]|nr:caspase family protein [Salinispira pacifica]